MACLAIILGGASLLPMRIIAGSAGRRAIKVPKAVVRPTTDRTREALFSMLNAKLSGAKVLDVFAGAGSMGLESLSRGALSCEFVDANRVCTRTIEENLKNLSLKGGKVVNADALAFLQRSKASYDLIFADPPYYKEAGDRDFVAEIFQLDSLADILATEGLLVVEVDSRYRLDLPEGWTVLDQRRYGGCSIVFIERSES